MIYITGDTHGEYDAFLDRLAATNIGKRDTVIICGDFGFVWGTAYHNHLLKELSTQPFTIAFVDGNHENFDLLYTYPLVDWRGGKAHKVADNIYHLTRGQIFTIEGSSFFTFGGAYSIDKAFRHEGVSWWQQELPSAEEYRTAVANLERADYKVDYVLTHTIPNRAVYALGSSPNNQDLELTGWLDWLYTQLQFKQWFAGHWHINKSLFDGKLRILFDEVVEPEAGV